MPNFEEEKLQSARIKMQRLLDNKGVIDEDVLAASIEVDILLNEYQKKHNKIFNQYQYHVKYFNHKE